MVTVDVLTLVMPTTSGPSVLVLQPVDEIGGKRPGRVVPIWVGVAEATQLSIALELVRFARPMTHDLFLDALTNLDTIIESVVIDDVKGATFFAKLKLRNQGRTIILDARPSDAIALAVREQAPIYMTEAVLEKASYPYLVGDVEDEEELAQFHEFVNSLAPEDFDSAGDAAGGIFRDVNSLADLNIEVPGEGNPADAADDADDENASRPE